MSDISLLHLYLLTDLAQKTHKDIINQKVFRSRKYSGLYPISLALTSASTLVIPN